MCSWQQQWICETTTASKCPRNEQLEATVEYFSIHPRTKEDIGYRLSRAGLAVFYKQNVEFLGPIISNAVVVTGNANIDITYGNVTGIELRNTAGFEVGCRHPSHRRLDQHFLS